LSGLLLPSKTIICAAETSNGSVYCVLVHSGNPVCQYAQIAIATESDQKHKEATMAGKSLYVGNLSYSTTENSLRELFAAYEPSEIRMIGDKGFGFVDVPEDKAGDAIAAMNGREVDGRAISVSEARPRAERTSGGGNAGSGRRW
jgi:RNA recognition motif-containing protein